MLDNSPVWIEVDVQGDMTGERYTGKFCVKKYLTQEERGAQARSTDERNYGIVEDIGQKAFNSLLSQAEAHVVEATDAPWWKKDPKGRVAGLLDDTPVNEIMKKVRELQSAWKTKADTTTTTA